MGRNFQRTTRRGGKGNAVFQPFVGVLDYSSWAIPPTPNPPTVGDTKPPSIWGDQFSGNWYGRLVDQWKGLDPITGSPITPSTYNTSQNVREKYPIPATSYTTDETTDLLTGLGGRGNTEITIGGNGNGKTNWIVIVGFVVVAAIIFRQR